MLLRFSSGGRMENKIKVVFLSLIHLINSELDAEWANVMALRSPKEWRVPDSPENFRAQSDSMDTITLWWDPPSSANEVMVRGYTLSYGIESSTQKIVIEGADANSFTVTSLKPNTTYVFSLTAYNEADGEDSQRVLLTAATRAPTVRSEKPLLSPSALRARFVSSTNEVLVTWTDPNLNATDSFPLTSDTINYGKQCYYIVEYCWIDATSTHSSTDEWRHKSLLTLSSDRPEVLIPPRAAQQVFKVHVRVADTSNVRRQSEWSAPLLVDLYKLQDEPADQRRTGKATAAAAAPRRSEHCDFESASICDFVNDPNATLEWRRVVTPSRQHSNGKHTMAVEYSSMSPPVVGDQKESANKKPKLTFARLLSPVYGLKKSEFLCVSFFYEIGLISYGAFLKVSVLHEADDWADAVLLMRKSLKSGQKAEKPRKGRRPQGQNANNTSSNEYYYDVKSEWRKVNLQTRAKPRRGFQVVFEVIKETADATFCFGIDDFKVAARQCASLERQPHGVVIDGSCFNQIYQRTTTA